MRLIAIFFMFSLLMNQALAYSAFGICNYGKENLPSIICSGPSVLVGTIISKDVKIAGELKANKITVGANLNVAGAVQMNDSKIVGPTTIIGSLEAKNVDFQKGIQIEADSITLNHTVVRGSMIITSKINKPYLRLYCSTTITGAVIFDEKEGVIEVSEESIVQGKIVNGTMEFVRKSCD